MGVHPEKKNECENVRVVAVKRERPVCENQEGNLCEDMRKQKVRSGAPRLEFGCIAHLEQSIVQFSAECQGKKRLGERKASTVGGIRSHIGARSGTTAASACSNRAVLTNEQD